MKQVNLALSSFAMSIFVSILTLSILIQLCTCDEILIKFVRDYYEVYNIHQVVVFGCWNSTDAVHISRNTMGFDTVVGYRPVTSNVDLSVLRVNYYRIGVVLDFDCASSTDVLDKFSHEMVFNESYYWLIFSSSRTVPVDTLNKLPLTIESDVVFGVRDNDNLFTLYDVYKMHYHYNDMVKVVYKGEWMPITGLKINLNQYRYTRRNNFHGLPVNISVVIINKNLTDLYTYLTNPKNPHSDNMSRSNYHFILYLAHVYNFSINLRVTNNWGYFVNGSYTGLIGDVLSGQVDMSATPLVFNSQRLDVIDYTVPLWMVDVAFLFRHPDTLQLRNNFLMPFANELWRIIIIVAGAYCLLLYISLKVELHYKLAELKNNSIPMPAAECCLTTVAASSQQGIGNGPDAYSGRVVFLSLFVWTLLLYQFYSGSIVSCLLTPPPRWIKTVSALSRSTLDVGTQDTPYWPNFFKTTTDSAIGELYERKIKPTAERRNGSYYTASEGLKKMKNGGFAFAMDIAGAYGYITKTFSEDEICELEKVRVIQPIYASLIITKKSPFRKMMIYGLRKIVEHGLVVHIRQIWCTPRPQCPETYQSKPTPMGPIPFSPALFLLLIGAGVSVLVLIVECIYHHVEQKVNIAKISAENDVEITD